MIDKIGIVLWYAALAALLFIGVKFSRKKEWNEGNMSFDQTKCFLGFCAVIICFHHMAQFTCAGWLNPYFIRKGLDIFVTAGYPMVAMFLFCSGFGLYKSAKAKPDFFKRFLPVRLVPILIPTLLTTLVYVYLRHLRNVPIRFNKVFSGTKKVFSGTFLPCNALKIKILHFYYILYTKKRLFFSSFWPKKKSKKKNFGASIFCRAINNFADQARRVKLTIASGKNKAKKRFYKEFRTR